ncbi:MAG: DUF2188 domain-containing protein [Gammaproteobacteria bacterium]
MSKKRDLHIVPHGGGWAVRKEGASRASSVHSRKADADATGRGQAKREKVELVIHGRNGRIQDSDSFGSDPHPPKDTKR